MEKEEEIIFQMYGIKGYSNSEEENEEKDEKNLIPNEKMCIL